MDNISIGIASYGDQPADWWEWLAWMCSMLHTEDINLVSIETARSMNTAGNRNRIVNAFLGRKGKNIADWLYWIDTDNITPAGGIRRLLDDRKEIVNGLYYQKSKEELPVAYMKTEFNHYEPITNWTRGELIPVAAAGMGATLVNRCVYEKIEEEFVVLQRHTGGVTCIHKDDIKGKIFKEPAKDGPKMVDGYLRERLITPTYDYKFFPHYILEYGRTEDMLFYENALQVGFVPYVDTMVEVDHLYWSKKTGATHRQAVRESKISIPQMTEYLDVELLEVSNDN
mgnify:CR=1 FL=1